MDSNLDDLQSKKITKNQRSSTSEIEKTLKLLNLVLEDISNDHIGLYIELATYLSSIQTLLKLPQRMIISLISSLIIYSKFTLPHTTESTKAEHKKLLTVLQSFLKRLTLNSQAKPIVKLSLRKTLKSFYDFQHNLVTSFFTKIDSNIQHLFNLLRNISIHSESIPFLWTLSALKSIISSSEIKNTFPTYTLLTSPYLPASESEKFSLVLDLDETLVHVSGNQVFVRPGVELFLGEMTELFEVILFTASVKTYADFIMKKIDPTDSVKLRLYRDHVSSDKFGYFKDLGKLGRDLRFLTIVDNSAMNFRYHKENGICIPSWTGDIEDNELGKIVSIMKAKLR